MGFTKFTKNVLNVSALPDRVQNQASSLKLVFDQAGVDIKAALNALISELEAKVAAANIGADVASVTEKNVQGILTAFENEIANRYTKAETNNAILADTNELIADVKIDLATGLLTVTKKNGTKQTFETSTEAESYAVGGTGTRPGEDTDNAKYYAQIAKQVAGGDFVTVVEMEGYAQKKGLYPNYNETELKGEVIETETTLEAESVLKVHGNSVQETRSGKNLFDSSATNKTPSKATNAVNGNEIKVTFVGGSTSYATLPIPNSEKLLGKKVTLSVGGIVPSASNVGRAGIFHYSPSSGVGSRYTFIDTVGSVSITLPNAFATDDGQFAILLYAHASASSPAETGDHVTYTNIQLEEGSTATSYEPYGASPSPEFESPIMSVSGDVEARVEGKNLANEIVAAVNVGANNGVYTQKTADTNTNIDWKVEGRLQGTFIKSFARFVDHGLGVKTASFVKDASFDRIYIGINGSARDTLIYIPVDDLINGETYTVQWNVLNTTQGSVSWTDVQLEKGATATPFVNPPKTISLPLGDIELRSTPDGTRDTFARVGGVWNKVSNVGNGVLNGTETWEGTPSYYTRVFASLVGAVPSATKFTGLSNYFKVYGFNQAKDQCLYFHPNSKALHVRNADNTYYATMQEWKDWLSAHPTEVIYPLATPTYTPITDSALISALDELEQLILHKGYNRITVTGVNGIKAYLELEISPTALTTNVTETEASTNMIVPVVSETGDVRVKIPATENQMTINPATGVVNVKGLTINGVSLDAYIRSIIG